MSALGFIGLGVMGEPMCRNLLRRATPTVFGFDLRPEPVARLREHGLTAADSLAAVARACDTVILSLPGGPQLEAVCSADDGLLRLARKGTMVVDTSTAPVALTRSLAERFARRGVDYIDAPVARTRAAAEAGTLSIMVGGTAAQFERARPLLECMGEVVTHCGPSGAGQVVKLMNNMVLFQTVVALAEALEVARHAGIDGEVLFDTLAQGSADSFALRNHGMRALLPHAFPENAFATDYAAKDLAYAMQLAAGAGIELQGASVAAELLSRSSAAGNATRYFPALIEVIGNAGSHTVPSAPGHD